MPFLQCKEHINYHCKDTKNLIITKPIKLFAKKSSLKIWFII